MADVYNTIINSVTTYKEKYLIPLLSSPEFMDEFKEMEVRDDDVFVVSYPKSGTHWMQEIVQLIFHDGQVEKLNENHRRSIAEVADVKVPLPHLKAAAGPVLRELRDDPFSRVLITHCPYALLPRQFYEKHPKVIYVYRNPKDSLVSRYNFNIKLAERELGKPVKHSPQLFSAFFDVVSPPNYAYGCWFNHVSNYWERKDDMNCFFVSYEEMKTDLDSIVKKVALFLCHPIEDEVVRQVVHNASLETMRLSFEKDQIRLTEQGKEVVDRNTFINKGMLFVGRKMLFCIADISYGVGMPFMITVPSTVAQCIAIILQLVQQRHTSEVNKWQTLFTNRQNELFDDLFMEKMKSCDLTKAYAGVENPVTKLNNAR